MLFLMGVLALLLTTPNANADDKEKYKLFAEETRKKTTLFSQPFPQPFPFSATVPKKISLFFVVAFVENKYLCRHI